MNYNYVFITANQSDLVVRFNDLNKTEYSRFIPHDPYLKIKKSKIITFFLKIHKSNRINNKINLPFKNIWHKHLNFDALKNINFNNSNTICFIIYARYFDSLIKSYRCEFMQYLRTKYLNCRIVLYYSDLIKNYSFNRDTEYRKQFDAIFTFEKKDALDNDFIYYEEQFFSDFDVNKNNLLPASLPKSDITFIGRAKNRLNDIISLFELFQENNLVCDFHIVKVPLFKQKYPSKINYHNKDIPYYEALQHVISSNCILEIMQKKSSSPTARVSEAVYFGKKLLSNCLDLKTKPYYNPEHISLFSNIKDINIEFIKKDAGIIDYNYKHNLSPLHFLDFVDDHLSSIKISSIKNIQ